MTTLDRLYARYDTHYARMQNEAPDWDAGEREPGRHAARRPWLPARRDAAILDVGCGQGRQLFELWCAGYRDLEGIEISEAQASAARKAAAGRVRIHLGEAGSFLAGRTQCYDLVILNDVLEHLPLEAGAALLRAMRDALRPGGTVVVRTPNMATLGAAWSRYLDLTHVLGFTEYSLVQLLEDAGFAEVRFYRDSLQWRWRHWRPWSPLRGLPWKGWLNRAVHRLVHWLRAQRPAPREFDYNLEAFARRPPAR